MENRWIFEFHGILLFSEEGSTPHETDFLFSSFAVFLPPIFFEATRAKKRPYHGAVGGGHANTWGMLSNGGSFIESTDKIVSYGITPQVVHLNFLRVSYGASSLPKCQLLVTKALRRFVNPGAAVVPPK